MIPTNADSIATPGVHIVFHYDGKDRTEVPDDATHVIVKSTLVANSNPDHPARLVMDAFVECPNLQSVVLPEGLRQIGQNAFYNCPVLKTIHLPSSLEEIHDNAFSFCFQLTNLWFTSSLQMIGENAFFECSKLKSLDLSACVQLRVIAECAFQRCIRMAIAFLPEGLQRIGKQAFSSCIALQKIILPDTVESVGEQAFADCSCLSHLLLSQSMDSIKEATFCGCDALTKVIIPRNVSIIEMDAFAHCDQLERVKFVEGNKLTILGESAFVSCQSLRHICAPSNLRQIGSFCFANCNNLVSVELPRCLEQVGEEAFSHCSTLRNIYFSTSSVHFEGPCLNHCTLLEEKCPDEVGRFLFGDRFQGLPMHKMAYLAAHENHDSLVQMGGGSALFLENEESSVDILGMTPFHILALSERPNQAVFEYILQTLPNSSLIICEKDDFGYTPMELLCSHPYFDESKAKVLLNHCIEITVMERIRWLGLPAWRMLLFLHIDDLFDGQQQQGMQRRLGDESGQVNSSIRVCKLHRLFEALSKYELLESTSLLEMALWKMHLEQLQPSPGDTPTVSVEASGTMPAMSFLRLTSRIQCKADIVLPNILLFLVKNTGL
ncbi:unnamed protein product [Cylindrotheca closterium]|uniref:Uncharacterized protein n=1 Tax=Cylindrotheca closterium TaxID=2856 RepID=A0AAD2GA29_9STRA|nr:unnamed protein product [Cylindrotheca closterium]